MYKKDNSSIIKHYFMHTGCLLYVSIIKTCHYIVPEAGILFHNFLFTVKPIVLNCVYPCDAISQNRRINIM